MSIAESDFTKDQRKARFVAVVQACRELGPTEWHNVDDLAKQTGISAQNITALQPFCLRSLRMEKRQNMESVGKRGGRKTFVILHPHLR